MVLPSPGLVAGFLWLLLFQFVGEVIVRSLMLPLPGPVLGMLVLFVVLVIRGGAPDHLRVTGSTLLQHLMLLLVPATAAVMLHLERVGAAWLPIVLGSVGGAAVTMGVTALTLRLLLARDTGRAR
jgi:holin-like protein